MEKVKDLSQEKVSWEALAKQDLEKFAKKVPMKVGDVMQFVFDAARESCEYNFFGCNDDEGKRLAVDLETIKKTLGPRPQCAEICKNGHCAYINNLAYAVGKKIMNESR